MLSICCWLVAQLPVLVLAWMVIGVMVMVVVVEIVLMLTTTMV